MSLMKTLALFLMLANAYALTPKGMVAEDYIYFKNNKHLLNLTIHKNLHPKDKEVIKYWLKKRFGQKIVHVKDVVQRAHPKKFFFGFRGRIKFIISYPDYNYNKQYDFAYKLCQKLKCDLIYTGTYISHYSYKDNPLHMDQAVLGKPVHLVKNDGVLDLKENISKDMYKKLYLHLDYEMSYWGERGDVIKYFRPARKKQRYTSGSFIEKDHVPFYLDGQFSDKKELYRLLGETNADCVYSATKLTLKYCKGSNKPVYPKVKLLPSKVVMKFKSGSGEFQFLRFYPRADLSTSLISDSYAEAIYDPEFVSILTKDKSTSYATFLDKKPSKYNWLNIYDSLVVEYFKKGDASVRLKLKNLNRKDSERLHDLVVEGILPEYFKIYHWKPDNELVYLGKYDSNLVKALERSAERKARPGPSFKAGLDFESRALYIVPSNTTINFTQRVKKDAISFYNVNASWWDDKSNYGAKFHYSTFQYKYNVISGGSTNALGYSDEFSLMGSYRFFEKPNPFADYFHLSAGYLTKDIYISTNSSIGNTKYDAIPIELEGVKRWRKLVFNGSLNYTWIRQAESTFSGGSVGGSGSGTSYGARFKASYPILKNTFFNFSYMRRFGNISYPNGSLDIGERGYAIGLEYMRFDF
jgi:hypothetical protein